jgi:hypothetical protein
MALGPRAFSARIAHEVKQQAQRLREQNDDGAFALDSLDNHRLPNAFSFPPQVAKFHGGFGTSFDCCWCSPL